MSKKVQQIRQEIQVVGFYLGNDEYAISINKVREIQGMLEIRKIPKAPPFVEGVINLRGKVMPVIDLRKRFDLSPSVDNSQAKILIVEHNKTHIGLVVDNVSEVIRLYADQIEKSPDIFSLAIDAKYIEGVAKLDNRLIVLLDVDKLFTFEEQNVLSGMNP